MLDYCLVFLAPAAISDEKENPPFIYTSCSALAAIYEISMYSTVSEEIFAEGHTGLNKSNDPYILLPRSTNVFIFNV